MAFSPQVLAYAVSPAIRARLNVAPSSTGRLVVNRRTAAADTCTAVPLTTAGTIGQDAISAAMASACCATCVPPPCAIDAAAGETIGGGASHHSGRAPSCIGAPPTSNATWVGAGIIAMTEGLPLLPSERTQHHGGNTRRSRCCTSTQELSTPQPSGGRGDNPLDGMVKSVRSDSQRRGTSWFSFLRLVLQQCSQWPPPVILSLAWRAMPSFRLATALALPLSMLSPFPPSGPASSQVPSSLRHQRRRPHKQMASPRRQTLSPLPA